MSESIDISASSPIEVAGRIRASAVTVDRIRAGVVTVERLRPVCLQRSTIPAPEDSPE